ncbi:MAG: HAMP domain-containing histidine kinase [candidate division Zixibacteria bacterium]|nr:HAMP domain-containing histidine kinase [candidate division Zixibacteria bacterium]
MRFKKEKDPIRFAFIIFMVLVVFSVGQLTWWIIFQIDTGRKQKQYQLDIIDQEIAYLAHHINRDFQSFVDIASLAHGSLAGQPAELKKFYDNLLDNPVVAGYRIMDADGRILYQGGVIDSTFYVVIGTNARLFFDRAYPEKIIKTHKAELDFKVAGFHDGREIPWVAESMLSIPPDVETQLEKESRRHIVMFVSEGGFFMLLVLFGAYLIYRTLQRSEDLKSRQQNFIQAVTHEFRTPLTSMRLYLETLASGKVSSEKTGDLFPKMLEDCDRLDRLVDNVLQASLYNQDDYRLNLAETDLAEDVNDYLNSMVPFIERHNGELYRELEPGLRVKTDYQSLGRAVAALVDNALKYSPTEKRRLEVTLRKNADRAELSVADIGAGIPSGEQDRIFERFYRVGNETTRSVKGTGLGLYLVRQIVEAHRGEVEVSSDGAGQGSVFTIKLPMVSG